MERARVQILPPETAKRIAAGEVIERPASALRELLDNSLDAGADSITVDLQDGGMGLLCVSDNGSGMDKEDLALSVLPHATSKIRQADDLLTLSTLGFRGEALASMAAVARVEIVSASSDDEAWRLYTSPNEEARLERCSGSRGTTVSIRDLFGNFPARKRFLKRPAAESLACRQTFLEKAMPFPERAFRLNVDGKPVLSLLPGDRIARVLANLPQDIDTVFVRELSARGPGYELSMVATLPDIYRNDRKHIQVYVNRRRVQEYGIAQAVEYAYRGSLPGGAWPIVYVFVDVDPALSDFNIHPAKREVRLKNLDDIRAGIIRSLRAFIADRRRPQYAPTASLNNPTASLNNPAASLNNPEAGQNNLAQKHSVKAGLESLLFGEQTHSYPEALTVARLKPAEFTQRADGGESATGRTYRYLGQVLGVFLVCEMPKELWLLDMHAAHERIIFNRLMEGTVARQELLVPVVREPESDDEDRWLEANRDTLARCGYAIMREGNAWLLTSLPAALPQSQAGAFFDIVLERPDASELYRVAASRSACRAAVMDGDTLDDHAAISIIDGALALPDPHCPHGRPIWIRLSQEDLYRAVLRLV